MGVVKPKRISRQSRYFVFVVVTLIILIVAGFGIAFLVCKITTPGNEPASSDVKNTTTDANSQAAPETKEEKTIDPVDFQSTIDEWVTTVNGNKSILIYDLDLGTLAGTYNAEEDYNTASLYKLFVVYEGYKRVFEGTWDKDARAGSTGKTIAKCLDLAIRESYSPCAETLWAMIGHDTLDAIIETEWGIKNSDISRLTSNVNDIMLIMKRFYEHPDFDDPALLDVMWDSFLNQPETTYEWRQGLPSGFSKASVYDKVGWAYNATGKYWNIYHDAAIVKFPGADGTTRNFIVVVMTNKIDFKDIRRFGQMLEDRFYKEKI